MPLEPAVVIGGDTGEPVAIGGTGKAAEAFRAIARRIADDIAPPADPSAIDMAGCSARLLATVEEALSRSPA